MDYIPAEALPLLVAGCYLLAGAPLVVASFFHQERQYEKEMRDDG